MINSSSRSIIGFWPMIEAEMCCLRFPSA